jgi:hypothetical protein
MMRISERLAAAVGIALIGVLAACGDDAGSDPASMPDAGHDGGAIADDGGAIPDAGGDAGQAADAGFVELACRAPAGGDETEPDPELALEAPARPPIGPQFVVAVSSAREFSGDVVLCVDGRQVATAHVYHGRGSAKLTLERAGHMQLLARAGHASAELELVPEERPTRRLQGELEGEDLLWGAEADVIASGDLHVAAGDTLVIAAGARVLFESKAAIEIDGALRVEGDAQQPVLFTRVSDRSWGGLRFAAGATGALQHAWFTGGGGDSSRNYGHSDSQPVIWIDHAEVTFEGGGIVDNRGKGLGGIGAQLTLRDALLSRCDTGGQLNDSRLLIERTHVLEMPDADGEFDDDDNDGLYISGAAEDADGKPILSVIRDSVFAVGEDDAIDHNDAELRVERVWIEGFRHEGVAASVGHTITVVDSVVRDSDQGIEAGYGSPHVVVEHCLLTENGTGLRVGDSYDWDTSGSLTVRNTIAYANHDANVRNYVRQIDGPLEGALHIECSLVDDPDYDGSDGNLGGAPSGDFATRGCASGPTPTSAACGDEPPGPRTCFF